MEEKKLKTAEEYLKRSRRLQVEGGLKLLERMNPLQGEFVLDLGCGTGNLSSVIAERVGAEGRVLAIDPDGHRIALARKTFGHLKNITFEEGSSDSLPGFGVAGFDAVFMNFVLHWIKDKERALKNIYESLKPGGRLAMLYSPAVPPLVEKGIKELNPEENYRRWKGMPFCEAKLNIENYCREAGLVIGESTEIKQCVVHENLSDYVGLLAATHQGVFDMDLIGERNLRKFKLVLDKEGCLVDGYPVVIATATKML